MRLNHFLSQQSTPQLLGWILKGCAAACAVGLVLSGWGMSQAYKRCGETKLALESEEAVAVQTEDELARKPVSLFKGLPQDSRLGQDQYLASFIEELGILADEAGCRVISVQSGTVAMQGAAGTQQRLEGPGGDAGQAIQEAAQAAQQAAQAAAQARDKAAQAVGTPSGVAGVPPQTAGGETAGGQATGGSGWEEIQLEASLQGDFFGCLRLLDALTQSGKVCAVRGFELSRSSVDHDSGEVRVLLKLLISIFRKA